MKIETVPFAVALLLGGVLPAPPASAMTLKECSQLYQSAKKDGTLGDATWSSFRASRCAGASSQPAAAPAGNEQADTGAPKAAGTAPASLPTHALDAILPSTIDPKFAAEKPSLQRLHTCSLAYRAAKKEGKLAGLRWIQKGGGFYSLCTARLKTAGKG